MRTVSPSHRVAYGLPPTRFNAPIRVSILAKDGHLLVRSFYRLFGLGIQQLLVGIGAFVRLSLVFGRHLLGHTGGLTGKLRRAEPERG